MNGLTFQATHQYTGGFRLDASFGIGSGVTGLFGASGSGKSTVLAILSGALRPTAGRICLSGRALLDTGAGVCVPPEERHLGVVFQDHLLFPHLTVRGNLRYGVRRHRARHIDFNRLVELLELGDLLERHPNSLSGGERQRTALGRAILAGPELLLMDEPLAALDAPLKERILTYLERAIAEWHIPTILVSHDQADIRRLADHVVVMTDGSVVETGPTTACLDHAVITGLKSHSGPVNLVRVEGLTRQGGHWEGRLGEERFYLPGELEFTGNSAYVQFLPSDVTLSRAVVSGTSVRNQLSGLVRDIVGVDGRVFVAIDVGQGIWAEITADAARELALAPGAAIVCLIKARAVKVVH